MSEWKPTAIKLVAALASEHEEIRGKALHAIGRASNQLATAANLDALQQGYLEAATNHDSFIREFQTRLILDDHDHPSSYTPKADRFHKAYNELISYTGSTGHLGIATSIPGLDVATTAWTIIDGIWKHIEKAKDVRISEEKGVSDVLEKLLMDDWIDLVHKFTKTGEAPKV